MAEATTGMVGRGFYDRHSEFQRRVAEQAGAALAELAGRVTLPPDGDGGAFGVADYGCAEGRNSIATVGRVLDAVAKRCPAGSALEMFVVHNDLPTNDFATLLANLAAPGSYLAGRPDVRVLTAPRSFFERVVPLGTIRFGTSDSAAHWLSRQPPGLDLPHALYRSDAPPAELAKILAQAAADWRAFLAARAEELAPGGVLLVQMLGADLAGPEPRVSAAGLTRLMAGCLEQLVGEGLVRREVYAGWCFPVVPRTVEECLAPVREGPLAGAFEVVRCELTPVPSPYEEAFARTGDTTTFARDYAAFARAFSETSLAAGLFTPSGADPKVAADHLYGLMQARLRAEPEAYPFDDLTLTVALQRQ
jgi:gibberellin A4 carboxyl methyltransferase